MTRKVREDLGEANLVNEGLQSQHKILEQRIKALNLELEEETKRREAAEKRNLLPGANFGTTDSFQTVHNQLTDKIKSIKTQEKLEQETILALNDKNDANQKVLQLNEELRKKDMTIQTQTQKIKSTEEELERMRVDIEKQQESNGFLKRKVKTLLESSARPTEDSEDSISRITPDAAVLSAVVQRQNNNLKDKLAEQEERHKLILLQMEKSYRDMQTVLQQEITGLKEEKRSLLQRIKSFMERRPEPPAAALPGIPINFEGQGGNGLDSNRTNPKPDSPGFQFGVDLRSKDPYLRDFDDCVSEPAPNRRSGTNRRRDPDDIDELVERINKKQPSRSNSPAAVARYISGQSPHLEAVTRIERSRPNSMLPPVQPQAQQYQQQQQFWAPSDYQQGPQQYQAAPQGYIPQPEEQYRQRPPPAVTISSDLGRTDAMTSLGGNILGLFQRPQFQ